MAADMSVLLGDLGGTHLRLALAKGGELASPATYKISEFPDITAVLDDYAKTSGAKNFTGYDFYLSHTGHIRGGSLTLDYKKTPWSFVLDDVRDKFGFAALNAVNDLKAMAHAPLSKNRALFKCFREAPGVAGTGAAIIGIGTGLGHAFLNGTYVHETYGGHFPPAAANDLQYDVIDVLRANADRELIFEDIVSGDGLFRIYKALAAINGTDAKAQNVADLIHMKDGDPLITDAAKTFCGFAGLYAHILANATYSYNGIYLCGGVTERLSRAGLFSASDFIAQYHQAMVPVVDQSLRATPLYISENEYIALYGLEVFANAA